MFLELTEHTIKIYQIDAHPASFRPGKRGQAPFFFLTRIFLEEDKKLFIISDNIRAYAMSISVVMRWSCFPLIRWELIAS